MNPPWFALPTALASIGLLAPFSVPQDLPPAAVAVPTIQRVTITGARSVSEADLAEDAAR